jgi:protein-tyrosine phosphatase
MLRPVHLPAFFVPGKLYLTSMPGRYGSIEKFLREIEDQDINHILCLVSDEEIAEKSPEYLEAIHQSRIPARLWQHSIPDYGAPGKPDEILQAVDAMKQALIRGESVVIHCAAGIGRTGMVATALLIRLGFSQPVATRTIEQAGSTPETDEQWEFIDLASR